MKTHNETMTINTTDTAGLGAGTSQGFPDPEVVAKPIRRQFSAQYRLPSLDEADRCT